MSVATFPRFAVIDGEAYGFQDGGEYGEETIPIKLNGYDKITVTDNLTVVNREPYRTPHPKDFANSLPKLDISNVKAVKIDHQAFKFEDVKKFENVEEAKIYNNDIKNDDGTDADPADVFKALKNVKRFIFRHESGMYKKETAANLVKEPHFAKLEQLILHKVTPDFDFNAFLNGVDKIHPNINCNISFKSDAFTNTEFEELKYKIRNMPPTFCPNLAVNY